MNTAVKQAILAKIKEYDRILIFRHKRVDGDCVGASKGLKEILRASLPQKDVRIIDDEHSEYLAFLGRMTKLFLMNSMLLRLVSMSMRRIRIESPTRSSPCAVKLSRLIITLIEPRMA